MLPILECIFQPVHHFLNMDTEVRLTESFAGVQTESLQYSGAYALSGFDNSLCLSDFCKNFQVEIISLEDDDIEFDMIGVDAAIANAFRRILIAEVS